VAAKKKINVVNYMDIYVALSIAPLIESKPFAKKIKIKYWKRKEFTNK
jgi:hypothetical protein